MKTMLFKDLKFGKDVLEGDSIRPYPTSEGLIRVNDESDLKNLQSYIDGNLEVVIDRKQPWFNVFTIPMWKEKLEQHKKGVAQTLKNWETTV